MAREWVIPNRNFPSLPSTKRQLTRDEESPRIGDFFPFFPQDLRQLFLRLHCWNCLISSGARQLPQVPLPAPQSTANDIKAFIIPPRWRWKNGKCPVEFALRLFSQVLIFYFFIGNFCEARKSSMESHRIIVEDYSTKMWRNLWFCRSLSRRRPPFALVSGSTWVGILHKPTTNGNEARERQHVKELKWSVNANNSNCHFRVLSNFCLLPASPAPRPPFSFPTPTHISTSPHTPLLHAELECV